MMFEPVCVEVCGAKLSVMTLVPDMAYIKSLIKHKRIEMAENHEKVRQKAVKEGKAVPNAPELKHFYVELARPELTEEKAPEAGGGCGSDEGKAAKHILK
eukprot:6348416-Pyramimonas_sp.AAC.1